jgi:hypothetical protein
MSDLGSVIVKVMPVEYRRRAKYPNITVYYDVKIKKNIKTSEIRSKIETIKTKKKPNITANPYHYLFYQYDNAPMIIIDLDTGEFLTTKHVIEHYGLWKVKQQASIVLRLLKRLGYADYKRRVLSTYRLGTNKEDVQNFLNEYVQFIEWVNNGKV